MAKRPGGETPKGGDDIPGDNEIPDFGDDVAEEFWDEVPGIGQMRRAWRLAEKQITKKYRVEIERLKKMHDTMIATSRDQSELITLLKQEIRRLEQQADRLEEDRARLEAENKALKTPPEKPQQPPAR